MPNVQVSIYLNDEEFSKYLKDKENINAKARSAFKSALKKTKRVKK